MDPKVAETIALYEKCDRLETIRDVFDVLGGNRGVRALTGANPAAVCMWKRKGRFPANQTHTIERALAHKGYSIQPLVLGQKSQKSNSGRL